MNDLASGLVKQNWRVVVLTATGGPENSTTEDLTVIRLSSSIQSNNGVIGKAMKGTYFLISSLIWCLKHGNRGDVVLIVSNPPFIGLLGTILRKLKNMPYVFLFQDLFPQTAVISGLLPSSGPVASSFQWLMNVICKQAAKTVVLSDSMQTQLVQNLGQAESVTVIHNWAVEKALPIPLAKNPFAIQHGFQDRFTVQYSGNFGRLHDLKTLLDAAVILHANPMQFIFIGGGAKQSQIDNYCKFHSLSNVIRLHYQPRSTLKYSLGACDLSVIGLIPGAENSMAPCKFYGILASGKGVLLIAKKNCDLAQLVLTAGIGLVVEPGESEALADKLLQLSKNPQQVQDMGKRARSLYEKRFGRERSTLSYSSLLKSVR
ncbi:MULTISPECIES: glycosyltransferase family 4 protein [unclassified Synechococcus]|uniref:glycosyltransferase family 4 protein n=1 Tax=unclassified Synechococcus TaxID=2626047 RepID=UPI001CA3A848|nr:glycosyltransferase family 4 protein [Synechococcus sp. MIT S9220]